MLDLIASLLGLVPARPAREELRLDVRRVTRAILIGATLMILTVGLIGLVLRLAG